MSKIHYFQRYSSIENTVTNNTLLLVARIYNYAPEQASRLLSEIVGEPIDIGIEISQQGREAKSVPDGTIIQRSFKIVIESKVRAAVRKAQLLQHAKSFADETQKVLLLLTKQKLEEGEETELKAAIQKNCPGVLFKNVTYEEICGIIQDLFQRHENEMRSLVDDYVEYCNDTKLFDQSKYLMRIVPCGNSIELNKEFCMYFQPSDRRYTKHSYIGIYTKKEVQYVWKIDSVFDVKLEGSKLTKTLIKGRDTDEYDKRIKDMVKRAKIKCNYNIEYGHRFFCGEKAFKTEYRKVSSGGIQGARFVNLRSVIGEFSDDSDLAKKLRKETWK